MKEDISIPEVKEVYVAAIQEENKEFASRDWNVYLINNRADTIETVLIVSKGYGGNRVTSTMRKSISQLPSKNFAKIEFLQDEVLALDNEFSVSFFAEGKMFHKKFIFKKNTIHIGAVKEIPIIPQKGVPAE